MSTKVLNLTVAMLYTPVYWSILLLDKIRGSKHETRRISRRVS
jgi:hypothetical protein